MRIDTILENARIRTLSDDAPLANRLGILHGRVVALDGDLDGVSARETIDLGGAVVAPGFNDAHCHTTWFGLNLSEISLAGVTGMDDLTARLRAGEALTTSDWVIAADFSPLDIGGHHPPLTLLDGVAGGKPLVVKLITGHSVIANTRALEIAGVFAADFREPVGGSVRRDHAGRPTGVLEETAQALVLDLIRPYALDTVVDALDVATARYAQEGITSFTEAGVGAGMIGHTPLEVAAYQRALADGRLHARAQLMPTVANLTPLSGHVSDGAGRGLDLGIRSGFGDDRLSLGPVKLFFDGAISGETAAFTEPYAHGHSGSGYLTDDPGALIDRAVTAAAAGWSLAIHAIGDAALDVALDAIETARSTGVRGPVPDRVEHAAVIRPDQLRRLARARVAVAPHTSFFALAGDRMVEQIGPERAQRFYPVRSMLDAGITVAGSSDRPCADGTALRCIESYVTRESGSGRTTGNPAERISGVDALRLYTLGSAESTGTEQDKGSLPPGKLADLVVLDAAPDEVDAQSIHAIRVLGTMVGGQWTFDGSVAT